MKKPPRTLITSTSKPPPRRPHPKRHPHPQRHHPGRGQGGHRATNPMLPGVPVRMPAHKHKAPGHKKAKKPVKRKLAPGEGVACCAAEALAASLRLAGVPVGDEDVLALYWHTAADADAGATISATLAAAQRYGLAGVRPYVYSEYVYTHTLPGLVLGVTLPGGPHALTLDPSGAAWSWGGLYDPGDLEIEEAWLVDWGLEDRGQLAQVRVQDVPVDVMLGDLP